MSGCMIRAALQEELVAVQRLAAECEGAPCWSARVWASAMKGGQDRVTLVAAKANELVGLVVVGRVGEVAELETVAVAAAERGRGLGRALCEAGMQWAAEQGAARMELEVRASNGGARRLYERLGFAVQGERRGYYRAPVEDAVLMSACVAGRMRQG